MKKVPKVALVHDYLNEFGGAERVLLALSEIYPKAPIYTIYAKNNSAAWEHFKDKKIVESWFSHLPYSYKLISPLRFLIPFIWKRFDFSGYDVVITSASWAVTKGMKNAKKEICYLHTPPRYLYGYDTSRNWQNKWFSGLVRTYALVVNHFMRMYDYNQAQKVDHLIVNSKNIGKRVEKFYRRDDYKVIYPPVNTYQFRQRPVYQLSDTNYYLTGGRMVAAKNFDLIIKACQKEGVSLKLYGSGIEENKLKKLNGENVEFLGKISDSELINYYRGAKAFIVAQKDEDFGITPIEAAAAGTPTIAYRGGGYLESVVNGKTGIFFDELTVDSLTKAIKKFEKLSFKKSDLTNHAKKFSEERFKKEVVQFVNKYAGAT